MRLPAAQARAIDRHAASTVRVEVDKRLLARPLRPATRHGGTPFLPQVGETYAANGGYYSRKPNKKGELVWTWTTTHQAHVIVRDRHMATLGHLTDEEAKAEGYAGAEDFETTWVEHHDHAWIEKQIQTLREAGAEDAEDTRDEWARQRYVNRWAPAQVWVLEIEAVHDMPRLLPDEHGTVRVHDTADERPRTGDEGYTHTLSAAMDDLDAVDLRRLDPRWSQAAQARHRKAVAAAASDEAKRRDARRLARQVRQLAIDGDPRAEQVRQILNPETGQEAA